MRYMGIDIGGSLAKIVETDESGNITDTQLIKPDKTSELNNLIRKGALAGRVCITGIGAGRVDAKGLPVVTCHEFECFGRGAAKLCGGDIDCAVVCSMGTGTAFVRADNGEYSYMGGSGIGSGTVTGLGDRLIGVESQRRIAKMALAGHRENVNLTVGDIAHGTTEGLDPLITASNFGKTGICSGEDTAAAIINMVAEGIGVMAAFACKGTDIENVIFVGGMTAFECVRNTLKNVNVLHPELNFLIPDRGIYAGAYGAALSIQ